MKLGDWNGDPDPVMIDLGYYERELEEENRKAEQAEDDEDEGLNEDPGN